MDTVDLLEEKRQLLLHVENIHPVLESDKSAFVSLAYVNILLHQCKEFEGKTEVSYLGRGSY